MPAAKIQANRNYQGQRQAGRGGRVPEGKRLQCPKKNNTRRPTSAATENGERLIHVSGLRFPEPVGKRLDRRADGSLEKTPLLAGRSKAAVVIRQFFATAAEAFDQRFAADCKTLFFTGTFDAEVVGGESIAVPRAGQAAARGFFDPGDWNAIVSSTKEFLGFRQGPGLLRADIDRKGRDEVAEFWPLEPFQLDTADEVVAALDVVLPEARGCPMLIMPSSGSMIVDSETGELVKGPGGWRAVTPVDDATQIPRILEVIHLRCWARGVYRWAFVNKRGQFYDRSLADQALNRPTQPDYVVADLGDGLAPAADAAAVFNEDGPWLDAAGVVLTPEDRRLALDNIEAARTEMAPLINTLRKTAIKEHIGELVNKGVPREAAERAAIKRFEAGTLLGSDLLTLDDGRRSQRRCC